MSLLALIAVALTPPTHPATPAGAVARPLVGGNPAATGVVAISTVPADSAAAGPTPSGTRTAPTSKPTAKPVACQPTDQDRYVYSPDRLVVAKACIYVTGVVEAVRPEADGDLHVLVALDRAYTYLLRPANQGEELGDLVVEPICVKSVTQTDAIDDCAADPDPLQRPYPAVGERVWMEGRYVFDLDHGGWSELHPLFRWGIR